MKTKFCLTTASNIDANDYELYTILLKIEQHIVPTVSGPGVTQYTHRPKSTKTQ